MILIDIKPAKRRFSNRKQWKFEIKGVNGEPLDPRDTYANVGDIFKVINALHYDEIHVRVHYQSGVETTVLKAFDA